MGNICDHSCISDAYILLLSANDRITLVQENSSVHTAGIAEQLLVDLTERKF